jgi:hypothetical protein
MMLHAQDLKFRERFAWSNDRESLLRELIPDTEGYFYYHCLHYQTTGKTAEARSMLAAWQSKLGVSASNQSMLVRQELLEYSRDPSKTVQFLQQTYGINLQHAAPQKDEATVLPTKLDPAIVDRVALLKASLADAGRLGTIEDSALAEALAMVRSKEDLVEWLTRVTRPDTPGLVEAILRQLNQPDSRGFGWARIHRELSLAQLDQLSTKLPTLLQSEQFIQTKLAKIRPIDGESLQDRSTLLQHLERLEAFVTTLPESQNSLKASVLYHRLVLDEQRGSIDRERFIRYLSLPNNRSIVAKAWVEKNRARPPVQLNADYQSLVLLQPIRDDSQLIENYLTHFFKAGENVDSFASLVERDYLEDVFATTKILYGLGDPKRHYAKLSPEKQKSLQFRVEVKFAPTNKPVYTNKESVSLSVVLKNTPDVLLKVYRLNARNILLQSSEGIHTSIDLDGLVPNAERKLTYNFPSDRRHEEQIALPELEGPGIWIVDLLASGVRSRVLVQKGSIYGFHSLSDAGNVIRIIDAEGNHVPTATVWFGDREYLPEQDGDIVIPFANETKTATAVLVDGALATKDIFVHYAESHTLAANFLCDPQQFRTGAEGSVLIRPSLLCNGHPASLSEVEKPRLTIRFTDQDGIQSIRDFAITKLSDQEDIVQKFMVPPRLAKVQFSLIGTIRRLSNDVQVSLAANHELALNQTASTSVARDFFLRRDPSGYSLELRGRNGEAIGRQPVTLELQVRGLQSPSSARLATDEQGTIQLGKLSDVVRFKVSGAEANERIFDLSPTVSDWPSTLQVATNQVVELPWESSSSPASSRLSLSELRSNQIVAIANELVRAENGSLRIEGLKTGVYRLTDHETNQSTVIRVADGGIKDGLVIAKGWVSQASNPERTTIRRSEWKDNKLTIELGNVNANTRVHILATPFNHSRSAKQSLARPWPSPHETTLPIPSSLYVDSLKLDEEYQYILDRRGAKHYPGNMLPTPSVLIQPWELEVTRALDDRAVGGDPMPKLAPASPAPSRSEAESFRRMAAAAGVPEYEFLKNVAIVGSNIRPNGKGVIVLDGAQFGDRTNLVILAVDETSTASASVHLPTQPIATIDRRLAKTLDAGKHFVETKRTLVFKPTEVHTFGDAQSTRVKWIASITDVYQLYRNLLNDNPSFTKFEVISRWSELSQEEKLKQFGELSCHELHLYLYNHDRKFFDTSVKPFLQNKSSKQFMDHYLLEADLSTYSQPWRLAQLNAAEKVLLAKRVPALLPAIKRSMGDWIEANPPTIVDKTKLFEQALMNIDSSGALSFGSQSGGGMGAHGAVDQPIELGLMENLARKETDSEPFGNMDSRRSLKRSSKLSLERRQDKLFENIATTRKWAETQYYHIPLEGQTSNLIRPSAFWMDLLLHQDVQTAFISDHLEMAANNPTAALMALAVLQLPAKSDATVMEIVNGQLTAKIPSSAAAFVRGIQEITADNDGPAVLLSQQIYTANDPADSAKPLANQPLVRGVIYRLRTVVTNPNATRWVGQILQQIPSGAIALSNAKPTMTQQLELQPFATQEINALFYMPEAGTFQLVGSQLSTDDKRAAKASDQQIVVDAKPATVDQSTWYYIASWGTSDQVLEYLKTHNLAKLSLDAIAWRMTDKSFFDRCLSLLTESGIYEPSLWAYALKHGDTNRIREFLSNHEAIVAAVLPSFASDLLQVDADSRRQYEHLDFRPLVLARTYSLGGRSQLLNDGLQIQYEALLKKLAYQATPTNNDRIGYVYYLLCQNRIDDALALFEKIEPSTLETKLQYDYMATYLSFFQRDWDRAGSIAMQYREYPHPRWRDLFVQALDHIAERKAMEAGKVHEGGETIAWTNAADQRMLGGQRDANLSDLAKKQPSLTLQTTGERVILEYRNLDKVIVRYYLMDIELQFSRNPFVAKDGSRLSSIQANLEEVLNLANSAELVSRTLELPEAMKNRNVLVEVSGAGQTQSTLVVANSLRVSMAAGAGRLQVVERTSLRPVESTYVKVYQRSSGGKVSFYKDGYTDLRGQFDYASLSLDQLGQVERFAILVLHPEFGTVVQEVAPPKN